MSAFSIKELYEEHNIVLLSRNLRYHIKGKAAGFDIDRAIRTTIEKSPESFWLKNNGLTIICDRFEIDGNVIKLWDFSIVNGGQTSYVLHKSKILDANRDFWLSCKIIKTLSTYDKTLDNLFGAIIEEGITVYSFKCEQNKSLTAANFLKNDENYYLILQKRWSTLKREIKEIFANV